MAIIIIIIIDPIPVTRPPLVGWAFSPRAVYVARFFENM